MTRPSRAWLGLVVVAAGLWPALAASPARGEEDLGAVLARLGPPGRLWGRLSVEEESPYGPTTPLAGVEVVAYPYLPGVVDQLERIRESARESTGQFDTAASRIEQVLAAFERRVRVALGLPAAEPAAGSAGARPPAPAGPVEATGGPATSRDDAPVRRTETDGTGVFVFDGLPSGDWLVVARRVAALGSDRDEGRGPQGPRPPGSRFFTPAPSAPIKRAEVWVERVTVSPEPPARLLLTDRARWFVGPLR